MDSNQAIANYELLSALSGDMLKAAILGEWDYLISIEQQCTKLVDMMKAVDAEVILDQAGQLRKKQLINEILVDEAEIRQRTQAWMAQLRLNMQNNRQEQRLLHAYGA